MDKLFGFAQFEFAGSLALPDGRYLAREPRGDREESVLVLQTLGAPPAPGRRRRRPRASDRDASPGPLPLTRVTAVRAFSPFAGAEEAARWLDGATEAEDTADVLVADGIALLNRALHAQALAAGEEHGQALTPERAVRVRIGYGSGDEVADGRFTDAREVDVRASGASRRRRRLQDLRPQARVAALLGGGERAPACETLLLRARSDFDAGREREAALQLRIGLEALLAELPGAVDDRGHEKDLAALRERREEAVAAAEQALAGELDAHAATVVRELLELCERVVRRRRVLST